MQYFKANHSGEDLVLQKEEVEKVKWFPLIDLYDQIETKPDNFTPGLISVLKDFKNKLNEVN